MNFGRYLRAVRHLDDILIEAVWRTADEHHTPGRLSPWALPDDLASNLTIYWPSNYKWEGTRKWMDSMAASFAQFVPLELAPIPQDECFDGCIITHFNYRGCRHRVVIDHWDYIDRICAEALNDATIYFKMQYVQGGYGDPRIIPGGYPVGLREHYRYLERLRKTCDDRPKLFDVYGRFGLRFAAETRKRAITFLSEATDIGFVGGTDFVRTSRYLRDMARTRVGIDLPGNGDFCFRLIEYLSIGVCVVGPRPRTEFPVPLVDGEHIVYCKDDLSDMVAHVRRLLADDNERNRIARNAREYFDRYLHRDQMTRYYLRQFLDAAEQQPNPLQLSRTA